MQSSCNAPSVEDVFLCRNEGLLCESFQLLEEVRSRGRKKECPEITIHQLPLDDDLSQQLNVDDLRTVKDVVLEHLEGGNSVIVHCAQV